MMNWMLMKLMSELDLTTVRTSDNQNLKQDSQMLLILQRTQVTDEQSLSPLHFQKVVGSQMNYSCLIRMNS